jgi:hypothetical protein
MPYYHIDCTHKTKTNKTKTNNENNIVQAVRRNEQPVFVMENKWQQLLKTYPQVHISLLAETILIKPNDVVVLTEKYHSLATNSFLLHSYYNYRQLLLFRYNENVEYYIGVPGTYYERQRRIASMFGFEGFENGEARMNVDSDLKLYEGCFGYYMKYVEI